jgi:hypothetical protein
LNNFEDPIDVAQYIVVPESQYAVPVRLQNARALLIRLRCCCVLTPVNFQNDPMRVAGKIGAVTADLNLSTKMCSGCRKPMAQVPPQFSFRLRQLHTHLPSKPTLCRLAGSITDGPV